MSELKDLKELREDALLRIVAVLIHQLGDEVLISEREFEMLEGVEILTRRVTSEHIRMCLGEEISQHEEDEF